MHLFALALGASYTLVFALVYPQKVRSLTIVSSYLGIDDSEKHYLKANPGVRINAKRPYPLTWARLKSVKHPTLLSPVHYRW